MKEKQIREKALEILKKHGWVVWWPPSTPRFRSDIFTIFDLIALQGDRTLFIQLTTTGHTSERRKKILEFVTTYSTRISQVEIWSWHNKEARFYFQKLLYSDNNPAFIDVQLLELPREFSS
jgi:hypothetical protein